MQYSPDMTDVFYLLPTQLDKLVEKQRETHRRMLEQLLMVEQSHKQTLYKLEDEKRNHGEFIKKSDEFTNLLEQERERSVHELPGEVGQSVRKLAVPPKMAITICFSMEVSDCVYAGFLGEIW